MTLDNFKTSILKIPRPLKRLLAIIIDVNLSLFAVWLSFYLRVGEFLPLWEKYNEHYPLPACLAAIFIFILIFNFFSLYKIIFRYSDSQVMISLSKSALIYAIIYSTIFTLIGIDGVPRTVGIIQPIIFFLLVSLSRFFIFYSLRNVYLKQFNLQKKNQGVVQTICKSKKGSHQWCSSQY